MKIYVQCIMQFTCFLSSLFDTDENELQKIYLRTLWMKCKLEIQNQHDCENP